MYSLLDVKHTTAVKYDSGKLRIELIPPEVIEGIAAVLTFGAAKYADRNWEKGMPWGRCFAAAMRHLWAWWRGQDKDPESGINHLAHALCCIAFLLTYNIRCVGTDDRIINTGTEYEEWKRFQFGNIGEGSAQIPPCCEKGSGTSKSRAS